MRSTLAALLFSLFALDAPVFAAIAGTGSLQGTVQASPALGQLTVYAYDAERRIGYMVFVVDGRYRATNLFPGKYTVTLRGTPGQRSWSLPPRSTNARIVADKTAQADFVVTDSTLAPTYVGGMVYPDASVAKYDEIYPPGEARQVLERVCFGCHTAQLYPYNVVRTYPTGRNKFDREGWHVTIERMANGVAFGTKGKPSYFDPLLISPRERELLADYLGTHFGLDAKPRAVMQESDPELDPAILAKAQYVEYRFPNVAGEPDRFTHTPDFDGRGNVWIMDRGGESLVEVDPVAGRITDHKGHGGGEFLALDRDGTVWYGGLSHFDPKQNAHDEYKFEWKQSFRSIPVSSMVLDAHGDLWLTLLTTGGLGKLDRKTNTIVWWDVPVARARPYGIVLDRNDNVWFAGYHTSGIERFDPKTESFRHYRLTTGAPTNIRRPAVDSKNAVWSVTWGSFAMQNGALYRLDQTTNQVEEFKLGIPYTNPYDVEPDRDDNIWIATDNHVLKFDPRSKKFARYPVTTRTDIPKLAVTRDGAVWFGPRNAGQSGGYGGALTALYPDKDAIRSFAAFYADDNTRNRKAHNDWAPISVRGQRVLVPAAPRNPCEFAETVGLGAGCNVKPAADGSGAASINGGAARE